MAWGVLAHAAPPAPKTFRIGVLTWSSTIEGQRVMREGLEAEAAALGTLDGGARVELLTRVAGDGPSGPKRQLAQMRELISQRVDALIVQPTDNVALGPALREANAAHIPVVAYDQYIEGGELAAYVSSDNRQAGLLDGEYIAHHFPPGKPLRLILVEYPQVSSTVERLDGFLAALKARGRTFTIVKTYAAVEPVAGRAVGAQVLTDFPKPGSIDVVFTVNDGGGLAVVDALAAAGRTEIVVATIDGDPRSVENIKAGRLTVIDAAQFCGPLGATAFRATWALLHGQRGARVQLVPTFPITRETLRLYPGWAGPLPAGFEKPWAPGERWEPQLHQVPAP